MARRRRKRRQRKLQKAPRRVLTLKTITRPPARYHLGLSRLQQKAVLQRSLPLKVDQRRLRRKKRLKQYLTTKNVVKNNRARKLSLTYSDPILNKTKTICESRKIREQVLHALKKTGKSGQKKPIRKNPNIICRRK